MTTTPAPEPASPVAFGTPVPSSDEIARLTEGIRTAARLVAFDHEDQPEYWQRMTRAALDEAGIPVTDEGFTRAWRCMWQSAFMGGNYRLDAARVLRAVAGGDR